MDTDISKLLNFVPASFAAAFVVISMIFVSLKSLLEFNDEYIQKRFFRRHTFLQSEASGLQSLTEFIEMVKHEEAFRVIFGRIASPRLASEIIALYKTGCFSLSELRACFPYTRLRDDGAIQISLGRLGICVAIVSAFFLLLWSIFVLSMVADLLAVKSLTALLTAIGILVVYTFFAWFFGRDIRSIILSFKASKKLEAVQAVGRNSGNGVQKWKRGRIYFLITPRWAVRVK